MPKPSYYLGLSSFQDKHHLAAVIIHTDGITVELVEYTQIPGTISAVKKLLSCYRNTISAIGLYPGLNTSGASLFDLESVLHDITIPVFTGFTCKEMSDSLQPWCLLGYALSHFYGNYRTPFTILSCADTIHAVKMADSGQYPDITELDVTAFRRLITNLTRRIYDRPVDIEAKIIPLGTYCDRLFKQLPKSIPTFNRPWEKSDDDHLALAILRHALRRRIQEPDLLYTLYDYLVASMSKLWFSGSERYYVLGTLTDHPWFMAILNKYFPKIVRFDAVPATHLNAFQAACLAGMQTQLQMYTTDHMLKNIRATAYLKAANPCDS